MVGLKRQECLPSSKGDSLSAGEISAIQLFILVNRFSALLANLL